MNAPLLAGRDLVRTFLAGRSGLQLRQRRAHAVDGVSLDVAEGETLAVVGESGCGKSTVARLLLGLLEPTGGTVEYGGSRLSKDRKTYTFKLREGVKWSDGRPFGADDVVYNLTEMAKFNTYLTSVLPIMDDVEKIDANTVEVHPKYPYTPFLKSIDVSAFPLVPKHVYERGNPATNPANVKPVGLGPFTLKEWKRDQSLTFVRNPNYREKPKPYLDEVVVALMQDERQQVNALLKGEVHFVQVPLSQLARVRQNAEQANVRTLQLDVPAPGRMVIEFNLKREPFDDPKVRQALFVAIDRQRIARDAQGRAAEPEVRAIPKQYDGHAARRSPSGDPRPRRPRSRHDVARRRRP
ncbi:MAG: ATP-binding cassette domain-containing protein [Streptosporangiales bacterium]|nr:ATP-binding cassette domain-containing protein [Streptosporangiales bacterium]